MSDEEAEYTPAEAIADQVAENSQENGEVRHVPDPAPLPESQPAPVPVLEFPDTVPAQTVQRAPVQSREAGPATPEAPVKTEAEPDRESASSTVDLSPLLAELRVIAEAMKGLREDLAKAPETAHETTAPIAPATTVEPQIPKTITLEEKHPAPTPEQPAKADGKGQDPEKSQAPPATDASPLLAELQAMTAEMRGLRTDFSRTQSVQAAQAAPKVNSRNMPREPVKQKFYKSSRQQATKKYKAEQQEYQAKLHEYQASQNPTAPADEEQPQGFGNVQDQGATPAKPRPALPAPAQVSESTEPDIPASPDASGQSTESVKNMQQQLQKTLSASQQSLSQVVGICQSVLQTLEQHSQQMEAMQERISSLAQTALQSTRGRSQRNGWK